MENIYKICEKAGKLLAYEGVCYHELYPMSERTMLVHVSGDWKHDHARCDYLLEKELGLKLVGCKLDEETDEDWYSAERYYIAKGA